MNKIIRLLMVGLVETKKVGRVETVSPIHSKHSGVRTVNRVARYNIKIMPCVEGDRSDCQPEASSIARSRRLMIVFITPKVYRSLTLFISVL